MGCRSNTHNAFRFAAGSLSGDLSPRVDIHATDLLLRGGYRAVKDGWREQRFRGSWVDLPAIVLCPPFERGLPHQVFRLGERQTW
jgi:hypothetical protein